MKILFVNPHYPCDPYTLLLHPPLGIGYLASVMKQSGHLVRFADLPFHGNSYTSILPFLDSFQPDIVGITCVAQSYCQAMEIADFIKLWRNNLPVFVGGPHVTFIAHEVLERHPSVDYVILFDGEESTLALANAIEAKARSNQLSKIPGIAFRSEDFITVTTPAPPEIDLDIYPRPDRSIFDMQRYLDYDYETVVITSRGCPSRCTFCSTTQSGRVYRWHSVEHVCDEIEEVLSLGFSSIFFGDDTFAGNRERIFLFCKEVQRRGLDFNWTSNIRALDAKPDVLQAMREAGAYRVFMGFESVQRETLKKIKKGTTPDFLYQTAKLVKSLGIELHTSFIIGAPGDTHESLEATLDFIRLIDPTIATFNVMEPRPGTDVYHHPEKYGLYIPNPYWYETTDWLNGAVCHTNTLTSQDISNWVDRCYDEFCSSDFRQSSLVNDLESVVAAWSSPTH